MAVRATPAEPGAGRLPRRAGGLALAAVLLGTFLVLLYMGRQTIFFLDDWLFWYPDPSFAPGDLLRHYNGHASPVVKGVWDLATVVTGGDSFWPYRVLLYLLHLLCLGLLYAVAAPRIGSRLALVVVLPATLMGVAWLDYLMPISGIYQMVSIAGLLGAVVVLDRDGRRADVVACVVLVVAVFSAAGGMAAVAGVAAWLLWPAPAPRWRRLWVPAVPLVLFALWYAFFAPEDGTPINPAADLALIPGYVSDGLTEGFRTYTFLSPTWATALALATVGLTAWVLGRRGGGERTLAAVVAGGVAFWVIMAIGRGPELRPNELRYLYPNALHAVMIAVVALGHTGLRSTWRTFAVGLVLALACLIPSAQTLRLTAIKERENSLKATAAISALEIAPDRADPTANVIFEHRNDGEFTNGEYLGAVRQGRSIAWTEEELRGKPERFRQVADASLLGLDGVTLAAAGPGSPRDCRPLTAGEAVVVPRERPLVVEHRGTGSAVVALGRFADEPRPIGKVAAGGRSGFTIEPDRSDRPWALTVRGSGPLRLCGAG